METLVFGRNRAQSALMMLGSLLFIAVGAWMLLADADEFRRQGPLMVRFWGAVTVVFFGATLVGWGSNLLRWSPALVLAPEGLRVNVGVAGRAPIPWEDILGFELGGKGPAMLVVQMRDPVGHARAGGPLRRLLDHANIRLCGSPVAIGTQTLRGHARAICDECNAWLARWRAAQASPAGGTESAPIGRRGVT